MRPTNRSVGRRQFLRGMIGAGTGISLFSILPRHVLGGPNETAPSDVIRFAVIGQGGMGRSAAGGYISRPGRENRRLVAVCDCDPSRLERSRQQFSEAAKENQGQDLVYYSDFREFLERTDIDAVHVATPPHWHILISIMCMQAGMDVKCEKPMTRFLAEGRALIETAKQYGRVCVVNSGGLGRGVCVPGRQLVDAGLLGQPHVGRVHLPYSTGRARPLPKTIEPSPEENPVYDMWCGPSPYNPWQGIVHGGFRSRWDYDGGMQADIGAHYILAPVYALNKLEEDPIEFEGEGHWPPDPEVAHPYHRVEARYADGAKMILESEVWGSKAPKGYTGVEGSNGKVFNLGHGRAASDPPALLEKTKELPEIPPRISFDEVIRTRDDKHARNPNAEMQYRVSKILHLSNIALRTGRKIRWDPQKEEIIGDPQANSMTDLPVRAPWRLY